MDFGGFWGAKWKGKPSQDRSKIDPKRHRKKDEKKEGVLDGLGVPRGGSGVPGGQGRGRISGPLMSIRGN